MTSYPNAPLSGRPLSPLPSPARAQYSKHPALTHHATSVPANSLPTYNSGGHGHGQSHAHAHDHDHDLDHDHNLDHAQAHAHTRGHALSDKDAPDSPPGAPTASSHHLALPHHAFTMPAGPLPSSYGSVSSELPPSYHSGPMSPGYHEPVHSPHPTRRHSAHHEMPKSATFRHIIPVDQEIHDDAVRQHHIPLNWQTSRFFLSSFEYLRHSYLPIHPAFSEWVHNAGPANLALIWREIKGEILLPVVVMYEYKSKANIEAFQTGARLEYLHLSDDGRSFTREYMGDICVREEWHLLHKNKPLLMFAQSGNPRLIPVRGEAFRPKGGKLGLVDVIFLLSDWRTNSGAPQIPKNSPQERSQTSSS